MRAELARAARFDDQVCLVIADLDDFKRVNDTLRPPVGDEVLKEFARALRSTVRESDVAGRWGGEEFVLVLTGTDTEGGARLAERARAAIESVTHRGPERRRGLGDGQLRRRRVVRAPAASTSCSRRPIRRSTQAKHDGQEPGRHLGGVGGPRRSSKLPPGERNGVRAGGIHGRRQSVDVRTGHPGAPGVEAPELGARARDAARQVHARRSVREPSALQDGRAGADRGHDGRRRRASSPTQTSLDWPTTEDTFIDEPQQDEPLASVEQPTEAHPAIDSEPDERSDENLWSRSRDFDWGD